MKHSRSKILAEHFTNNAKNGRKKGEDF